MSVSIGASSNMLSTLQSLLTQGVAGIADAASAGGPLAALFQSLSGSGSAPQASAAASTAPGSPFGAGTLAALLSIQGEQSSSTNSVLPSPLSQLHNDGGTAGQSDALTPKRAHSHHHRHHHGKREAASGHAPVNPPAAPGSTLSSSV
jgi:hypothetical protein